MRPTVPTNSLYNPFRNRFNDPVQKRIDDMRAYAWLRQRDQALRQTQRHANTNANHTSAEPKYAARIFGGTFVLFLLLVSVAALLRTL